MFECYVVVFLPLRYKGDSENLNLVVAKYDFDPGLQEHDLVRVENACIDPNTKEIKVQGLPKVSFDAHVSRRRKHVISGNSSESSIFRLFIDLDAEAGKRSEIVSALKNYASDVFEDFYLPWNVPPE